MSESLWTDERIDEACLEAFGEVGDGYAPRLMRQLRDEYEAALAEARKWVPPTTYSTGALSVGDRVYVEVPGWGDSAEDTAWEHLGDEP